MLHYVRSLSLGEAFVYAAEGTEDEEIVSASAKAFDGFELVDIGPDLDMINAAMRNVHFKGLQYKKFEEQSKPHLDKVAAYMSNNPELKALVVGHVASDMNVPGLGELSLIRAKTVCDYLESKGVSRDRLSPKGKGSTMPAVTPMTTKDRRSRRIGRVEIYFIK